MYETVYNAFCRAVTRFLFAITYRARHFLCFKIPLSAKTLPTVAVREHVMVAVSPHVTVQRRVYVSVSVQGCISSVSVYVQGYVSPDSQA